MRGSNTVHPCLILGLLPAFPPRPQPAPNDARAVAILRAAAVADLRNDRLAELVGELSMASPEFARFWADYQLFEHTHGTERFFHEAVGEMRLNCEALSLVSDRGQTVIIYTADKGSPSEDKLALLASWSATPTEPDPSKQVDDQWLNRQTSPPRTGSEIAMKEPS